MKRDRRGKGVGRFNVGRRKGNNKGRREEGKEGRKKTWKGGMSIVMRWGEEGGK